VRAAQVRIAAQRVEPVLSTLRRRDHDAFMQTRPTQHTSRHCCGFVMMQKPVASLNGAVVHFPQQ